jgi:transcription-repair coupling factor (superfamily II helicase)
VAGDCLQFLADILSKLPEYRTASSAVDSSCHFALTGLSGVHKAHITYALAVHKHKKLVIIAPDEQEAMNLVSDLKTFFGDGVYFYPSRDFVFRSVESVSHEFERERLRVLGHMANGDYNAVVACADGAMQYTIPLKEYKNRTIEIRKGCEIAPEKVVESLIAAGYARSEQVDGMGQFASRGGIIDFFPPHTEMPVRIEFWGDEPDTISYFDTETQRRTGSIDSIQITPALEVLFDSPKSLAEKIAEIRDKLNTKSAEKAKSLLWKDIDMLNGGAMLPVCDKYLPICYGGKPASLFNYLNGALLFVSEPSRVFDRAKNTLWQYNEDMKALFEEGVLCSGLDRFYLDIDDLYSIFEKNSAVYLDTFIHSSYETKIQSTVHFAAKQLSVWGGGIKLIVEDLEATLEKSGSAVVFAGTQRNADALIRELNDEGIAAHGVENFDKITDIAPKEVIILTGTLSSGMEYPSLGLTVITHGHLNTEKRRGRRFKKGERIRSLAELTPGDYVVHSAHGIGIYEGIHKLEVQGIVKDYIKIRYAGTDTLYVPVTQLDLVSKYIGAREDSKVRLNKMGGTEWKKAKSRTRAAVKDMAKELIALYAARQKLKGIAFEPDNDWQREFEERFEYEETEDQLRCAEEIKADMEKPFPMERLLCGDVGFGKTEVALRAAFKCVMSGKQCAILVPTTILAWQHFQTVTGRVEGFPVKVELLSRFRTVKEQHEIIKQLARGEVDIVIGTHRLVQKDVKFKDLGLLIIDEEQRFGVAHKEKLKERFKAVDVLVLSATPIPRTLNMALSGIRDMSIIEEAPQDRHPVQTYVLEHDWGVIADAIRKELRRGGQVYYLHNRVETIESTAAKIAALVPNARIGIGHGKMGEEDLSRVWERLLNHEIDILVCTTIIETGVDVPNCNTLIIEDADHMGLSQLHQIRGRVGRSSRRAFAYFTFKRGKVLSDIATKRLSAIREFTEFGSGFQIAMRDLEIRGAGNILGSQQHGHMEAVGYDMYLKLLNEAVLEEKGEQPAADYECMVDIQVSAHIPESYVSGPNQRLEIYRRIADIRSEDDVSDVLDELIDRFGDPPKAVKSLVDVALVRNTAASLGIKEISQRGNIIMLFSDKINFKAVSALVAKLHNRVMVSAGQKPYISVKMLDSQTPVDTIREALEILRLT